MYPKVKSIQNKRFYHRLIDYFNEKDALSHEEIKRLKIVLNQTHDKLLLRINKKNK